MTTLTYIGRRRVDPMSPARAIEMQKAGEDTKQIAAHFHISTMMLGAWFRYLDYDPLAYHGDAICDAVEAGQSLTAAMAAVGLHVGGTVYDKARVMLQERSIARRWMVNTAPTCAVCGILLEPYDASNIEQQSWQNGTRDGLHCTGCESRVDGGGGWLTRMPLLNTEETANMNLGEVRGYGF